MIVNNKGIIKLTTVNYNTTIIYLITYFSYLHYSTETIKRKKINQS